MTARHSNTVVLLVLFLFLATGGCDIPQVVGVNGGTSGSPPPPLDTFTLQRPDKIDLLFVLDNSPAMGAQAALLTKTLPNAIHLALSAWNSGGLAVHYHIGVVTTDLGAANHVLFGRRCQNGGDGGALYFLGKSAAPGCDQLPSSPSYIDYDQMTGQNNFLRGGSLADALGCMTAVGSLGCDFVQPLEAAYRALAQPPPDNAGFLRKDALLVVVFVTNQDDCSAPPTTQLFDPGAPAVVRLGPLTPFRCARYGIICGPGSALLAGDRASGPLGGCVPAPGSDGSTNDSMRLFGVARYRTLFTEPRSRGGLKDNPNDILVFAIAGPAAPLSVVIASPKTDSPASPPSHACVGAIDGTHCAPRLAPSCTTLGPPPGYADPAVRLQAVTLAALPGDVSSLCDGGSPAAILDRLKTVALAPPEGRGCLQAPFEDPSAPDCQVTQDFPGGPSNFPLPRCGAPPCWRIAPTPDCLPVLDTRSGLTSRLQLVIDRGTQPATPGTVTHVHCRLFLGH